MRAANMIKACLLILSLGYIVLYLFIALTRMRYPFGLEWMEGGSLEHVRRILSGQKLYVSPSIEFVPYIYTPLYFYLAAFVTRITTTGFTPLRLVSCLASLGTLNMIFFLVKKETQNTYFSLIAVGLFAATFHLSGAWFDIGRVDSLFLFWLLLAIYSFRYFSSNGGVILAGLFLSLSFFTKQTALVVFLPLIVFGFFSHWRRMIVFIGALGLFIGGSSWLLNIWHDGWFTYYVFLLPGRHALVKSMFINFWVKDLFLPLTLPCCIALYYVYLQMRVKTRHGKFYVFLLLGMLGGSWFSRLHSGGYNNVLLPGYAGICIVFGIALAQFFELLPTLSKSMQRIVKNFVYFACILQFFSLTYNLRDQVPSDQDVRAGTRLVKLLEEIDGDIWMPRHGYLSILAGKKSFAQEMAMYDVLRGDKHDMGNQLNRAITQAIAEKKFQAILLDYENPEMLQTYKEQMKIFENPEVFWPVTGMKTRPEFLYILPYKE